MTQAFVWWSESGGPGKTTNAMQTAAAIGRDGYEVLAWDLDPQRGALTHYCGYEDLDHDEADSEVEPTTMDVFFGDHAIHETIVETPHLDLVPGHEDLGNFESALDSSGRRGVDEYWVIREILEHLANGYDVFILDVQATLNRLVDNAVIGARNVMVPIELSPKGDASQRGLENTIDAMDSGFSKMGVDVVIKGAVPSRVGNAKIFEQYRDSMEERGVPLSPFSIPEHSLLRYTWDKRMDLFSFIDSEETRVLRSYEEHVPLAYKVIGRWMTGEYTYDQAVSKWDKVKNNEMGDAEPEKLLDDDVAGSEVNA
jgi:chromosome partitioning protein